MTSCCRDRPSASTLRHQRAARRGGRTDGRRRGPRGGPQRPRERSEIRDRSCPRRRIRECGPKSRVCDGQRLVWSGRRCTRERPARPCLRPANEQLADQREGTTRERAYERQLRDEAHGRLSTPQRGLELMAPVLTGGHRSRRDSRSRIPETRRCPEYGLDAVQQLDVEIGLRARRHFEPPRRRRVLFHVVVLGDRHTR